MIGRRWEPFDRLGLRRNLQNGKETTGKFHAGETMCVTIVPRWAKPLAQSDGSGPAEGPSRGGSGGGSVDQPGKKFRARTQTVSRNQIGLMTPARILCENHHKMWTTHLCDDRSVDGTGVGVKDCPPSSHFGAASRWVGHSRSRSHSSRTRPSVFNPEMHRARMHRARMHRARMHRSSRNQTQLEG